MTTTRSGIKRLVFGVVVAAIGTYLVLEEPTVELGPFVGGAGLLFVAWGLRALTRRRAVGVVVAVAAIAFVAGTIYRESSRMRRIHAEIAMARKLHDALWPVCAGTAVPQAAARAEQGRRPTVAFEHWTTRGHHAIGSRERWSATSVEATQLVACFEHGERVLGSCAYEGGLSSSIQRKQYVAYGTIREARSGKVVAKRGFEGSEPAPCPSVVKERVDSPSKGFYGSLPRLADFLPFLHEHVD